MELQVIGKGSEKKINFSDSTFGCEFKEGLVHQAVECYLAGKRQGTKAQKTRAEVRGGGKKPWKQKGTGRARAGTIRSPIWRGGGVTFAAETRDHSKKINKKMYKKAMASILSELIRQNRLSVISDLQVSKPKTRELVDKLKELDLGQVLIVTHNEDNNLMLASRNLADVLVCHSAQINPVDLISFEKVLFTVEALKQVEERLS